MIEFALQGSRRYWFWIFGLFTIIAVGGVFYYDQLKFGLMVTGQSRDVSWGFYTAQMTFFVGVAAGGIMLIIPSPLHRITEYTPSVHELLISAGIAAIGMLVLTMLYKITIRVKEYSESS